MEVREVVKNNGDAQILHLFHGTSATDPKLIYQSQEGFNLNYSNEGLWGKANYFAFNSSYSNNNYAHKLDGQHRQMFMARVSLGKEITLLPSAQNNKLQQLREPPMQEGKKIPYDSVKGNTMGSDVIMIYTNKKAYPEYLITYR